MSEKSALAWYTASHILKTVALIPVCIWFIESCGRRPLFLLSALGCFLSIVTVTVLFFIKADFVLVACCFCVFYTAFSIGYGPVVFAYCSEILSNKQRGKALALSQIPADLFMYLLLIVSPVLWQTQSFLPFLV